MGLLKSYVYVEEESKRKIQSYCVEVRWSQAGCLVVGKVEEKRNRGIRDFCINPFSTETHFYLGFCV